MDLTGKRIVECRPMAAQEMKEEDWEQQVNPPPVLVLDDGTKLYTSRDAEGNGPGCFFGVESSGATFRLVTR